MNALMYTIRNSKICNNFWSQIKYILSRVFDGVSQIASLPTEY